MHYLFMVLLLLSGLFLILVILVQRGKGGGLAGAFGGLGGQSAFGAKAGDTFTRITIGVAAVWILLCMLSVRMLGSGEGGLQLGGPSTPAQRGTAPTSPAHEARSPGASGGSSDEARGSSPASSSDAGAPSGDSGEGGR